MKLLFLVGWIALSLGCLERRSLPEYGLPKEETLRINIVGEPPSLDWHKASDTTSSLISGNTMEGLVSINFKDPHLSLQPALATEWKSFNNSQRWVFTLRKGVLWTDGVELTAQHVLDGWERLLTPQTGAPYGYFLFNIQGARDFSTGKTKDFSQVGARINSSGQIEVNLVGPQSFFSYMLTHPSTYPFRLDVAKKFGVRWTEAKNIVTLGAYQLKIWEHDKAIVMTRNPGYYGSPAKIKNILAYMIGNLSTSLTLFDSGQLDFQDSLPSVLLSQLSKRPEFYNSPSLGIYYYGMNVKKPPMDDVNFRKAIAHAIDRKEVVHLIQGGKIPTSSFVPKGMFGYEPSVGLKFNVEMAQKYLRQSRYAENRPRMVLAFNTSEDHKRIAENIQTQLKKNLGLKVELQNEEWKVYLSRLKTDAPQLYRAAWLADYPDPDNFLNLWTSFSENNNTNWGDEKYDTLIAQGAIETNSTKRRHIYREAQKYMLEEVVPIVPIYIYSFNTLVSTRFINPPINVMGDRRFKDMEFKK